MAKSDDLALLAKRLTALADFVDIAPELERLGSIAKLEAEIQGRVDRLKREETTILASYRAQVDQEAAVQAKSIKAAAEAQFAAAARNAKEKAEQIHAEARAYRDGLVAGAEAKVKEADDYVAAAQAALADLLVGAKAAEARRANAERALAKLKSSLGE